MGWEGMGMAFPRFFTLDLKICISYSHILCIAPDFAQMNKCQAISCV